MTLYKLTDFSLFWCLFLNFLLYFIHFLFYIFIFHFLWKAERGGEGETFLLSSYSPNAHVSQGQEDVKSQNSIHIHVCGKDSTWPIIWQLLGCTLSGSWIQSGETKTQTGCSGRYVNIPGGGLDAVPSTHPYALVTYKIEESTVVSLTCLLWLTMWSA